MNKNLVICLLFSPVAIVAMDAPRRNSSPQTLRPTYSTNLNRLSGNKAETSPIPMTRSGEFLRPANQAKTPSRPITPGDYFVYQGSSPSPSDYASLK